MKEKKEMLDKKISNLKSKKIIKKKSLQEKGITLIALVVTIIILLILAGVTLNIALSDNGLFSKAKKAADDYKKAQNEEEESIRQIATQMYSEYIGAKITVQGLENIENEITIKGTESGLGNSNTDNINGVGDDGSQKFTTEELEWRIWDFDGNTLRIISEEPTTQKLTLRGATGYNNGVWILENICNTLYSNGKEELSATNLKRSDIEKITNYDYTESYHIDNAVESDKNDNSFGYAESKTYEENYEIPTMWKENDSKWEFESNEGKKNGYDKEAKIWETTNKIKSNESIVNSNNNVIKQSFWKHKFDKNEFISNKYYDILFDKDGKIFNKSAYWLMTRYVYTVKEKFDFGLCKIQGENGSGVVHGELLFDPSIEEKDFSRTCALRPMITIKLNTGSCKLTEKISTDGEKEFEVNWVN